MIRKFLLVAVLGSTFAALSAPASAAISAQDKRCLASCAATYKHALHNCPHRPLAVAHRCTTTASADEGRCDRHCR